MPAREARGDPIPETKVARKQVTKKEACEETMARLEREIDRLSKGHIYVEADVPFDVLRVSIDA
jgi:hypothetical protein